MHYICTSIVAIASLGITGTGLGQVTFEFTNSGQALGNSVSYSVALGDLDGDGDLDAMVGNYGQPNTVWTNDGTGTFTDSMQAFGNSNSYSVALGDLNGDGDLDAMVANYNQPNTVWTNTVTGTGVCCAPSGCMVATENLAGLCEGLGGVYITIGTCEDCPAPCIADIVVNEQVDVHDLMYLLEQWGACP